MPHIILLGTLDSKLEEFLYLYNQLSLPAVRSLTPIKITLIDCGRTSVSNEAITISQPDLISRYGPKDGPHSLEDTPRGEVIKYMTTCATACVRQLISQGDVHAIMSAGGSGGTSLAAAVMREATPIGMPKMIVSTVASGDTAPLVGETDITLMYSAVDVAGSNGLLHNILSNAAGAIAGMASSFERFQNAQKAEHKRRRIRIGVTMFGVTTPCVDKVRARLEETYSAEVYVFHATGHGGRAMERLVEEGRLDAVLDVTTTEICDYLMGGNMSAGLHRLEAALKAGIPNVISLGATDMVNFGPRSSVPDKYSGRKLFEHNSTVTLMRTTREELVEVGEFIVDKIKTHAADPTQVQLRIPRGGVSMIAIPGGPFADEAADVQLAETVKRGLSETGVRIIEDDRDINSEGFAVDIAEQLMQMVHRVPS